MLKTIGVVKQKLVIYFIFLLLLALLGISNIILITDAGEQTDNVVQNDTIIGDSRTGSTKIDGYIQLWDYYDYVPHDGVYGDDDEYSFNLGSDYNYFRIFLRNIDTVDYYLLDLTTYLRCIGDSSNVIKITSPFYNRSYIDYGDYEPFYYSFKIGPNGLFKTYELALDIQFTYVDSNYDSFPNAGTIYFKILLSSRIKSNEYGNNFILNSADKYGNFKPLYSGTKNRLLILNDIYSSSGTLDNVKFKLQLPSNFKLKSDISDLDRINTQYYSNDDPMWLLEDSGDLDITAQTLAGKLEVSYELDGTLITESGLPIKIEVIETPILCLKEQILESDIGVMKNGKLLSNLELFQKTETQIFKLDFSNVGNIDLTDVEVGLDLENSNYFYNPNFYYDEGDYSNKQSCNDLIPFGDIPTGSSVIKEFSIKTLENTPPGLYKIPIKYTATYVTNSLLKEDLSVDDFHVEIMNSRLGNNQGFKPFIIVHVLEGDSAKDLIEPDLFALSETYLRCGMHGISLTVQLTNLEYYQLTKVNSQIQTGGNSPLLPLNEKGATVKWISSQEHDYIIPGVNNRYGSNIVNVHFILDVSSETLPGVYDVPIKITCVNEYEEERITTVNVQLNIYPIPPKLVISDIITDDIYPNSNFQLNAKLNNIGGSNAKKVYLMFNDSSNLFSAERSILEQKNINVTEEVRFSFNIITGYIIPGKTYQCRLFFSYEDEIGNIYSFETNSPVIMPLFVLENETEPVEISVPKLIISDVSTTEIKPNSNFTLKLKIYNDEEVHVKNVYVMFDGSSNIFSPEKTTLGPNIITSKNEMIFEFLIHTGAVEPGNNYLVPILISYEDFAGVYHPFNPTDAQEINLQVKSQLTEKENETTKQEEKSDLDIINIENKESSNIYDNYIILILGIFILVSAILFSFTQFKISKKDQLENKSIDIGNWDDSLLSMSRPKSEISQKRTRTPIPPTTPLPTQVTPQRFFKQQFPAKTQPQPLNSQTSQNIISSAPKTTTIPAPTPAVNNEMSEEPESTDREVQN